jgi:U4/U6.U5 tri-snRNP component SNU23
MLREKTKEASKAKAFDFDARLEEVRRKEEEAREAKRAEKKAARDARLIDAVKDPESDAITQMMGFGGFGTTKKT